MKTGPGVLLAIALVGCLILGCVSAVKSVKQDSQEGAEGSAKTAGETPGPQPSPPPPPPLEKPTYDPPSSPAKGSSELRGQEEVRDSAMLFLKSIPDLRNAKICYSKMYGQWVLDVFAGKDAKTTKQQFEFDPRTKEFQVSGPQVKIPKDQIDFHLKKEVNDETCFVLK
jgi:hypothetical protein